MDIQKGPAVRSLVKAYVHRKRKFLYETCGPYRHLVVKNFYLHSVLDEKSPIFISVSGQILFIFDVNIGLNARF